MAQHTSRPRYFGGWGSRFMNDVTLVLAQVCAVISGLVIWGIAGLFARMAPLERADYVHMAIGFGLSAVLLLVSLIPARALRCSTWVLVLALVLAAWCLVKVGYAVSDAANAPPDPGVSLEWWRTVGFFFMVPSSWPVLLLAVRIPFSRHQLTGSSSPGPRAQPDH